MTEIFETTDLETVEYTLSDTYGKMRLSAPDARGAMRMSQTPLGSSARLDCFTFTMSLDASVSQLGVLVFGELKSGRLRFESGRSDRRFGPGGVYFAASRNTRTRPPSKNPNSSKPSWTRPCSARSPTSPRPRA